MVDPSEIARSLGGMDVAKAEELTRIAINDNVPVGEILDNRSPERGRLRGKVKTLHEYGKYPVSLQAINGCK